MEYYLKRETFLDEHGQPPSAFNLKYRMGREMDELLGICKGVISDGMVADQEAEYLNHWLNTNQEIASLWPAKELASRLGRILMDGRVTEGEREGCSFFATGDRGEC